MKRTGFGAAGILVALAMLGGSVTAANAATFNVVGEETGEVRESRNSFAFRERLTDNGEHVGRLRAVVTRVGKRTFEAKALFRFKGGKIRAAGSLSRGELVLPITGGKGKYHGISGRVLIDNSIGRDGLTRYTFKYSR